MNVRSRGTRRTRRAAAALAAVAAGAAVAVAAVPAAAASASGTPRYLAPSELPPHPTSPWYAGPVTAGQPEALPACGGELLPSIASHRSYWTDLDTNALQVTVVERSEKRAKKFAALLRKDLAGCAEKLMQQYPDVTAAQKYYGRLNVEEGAYVYGVHTTATWGASDINLYSVGRDGRTVTLVRWGQMGDFQHAQVDDFKNTTVTAVNKLY
ncbi:hypothetical protein ACFS5L_33500 [Streptomyces phyllanthi]|uniref:Sensor domain-containing protein n=1 Tax=Streptomyces phyllanthi TaxID=1803180 RepID=A0A5N8W005_9ACTN|nr:hypothetical protein [Streptomyces phyllanthi]MPY40840.1 hypothetical protein [Streptomyces phyllanthi]